MSEAVDAIRTFVTPVDPALAQRISLEFDDPALRVRRDELLEAMDSLRSAGFERLTMATAVDRGEVFEIVYRLYSRSHSIGMAVRSEAPREDPRLDSLCSVWPAANWQEREIFDMYGIVFDGHPDLRRILLPEDWPGWPLRKDYDDPNVIKRPDYI